MRRYLTRHFITTVGAAGLWLALFTTLTAITLIARDQTGFFDWLALAVPVVLTGRILHFLSRRPEPFSESDVFVFRLAISLPIVIYVVIGSATR